MCSETNPLFYMAQCGKPIEPGGFVIVGAMPDHSNRLAGGEQMPSQSYAAFVVGASDLGTQARGLGSLLTDLHPRQPAPGPRAQACLLKQIFQRPRWTTRIQFQAFAA